jgi:hypothetical protein
MNILIYLGHPAQYHFFKNIIKGLNNNHSVVVLIKTKDVLEKLLMNDGIDYVNIQTKNRKNSSISILLASFRRTIQVYKIAKDRKIDVLLGTDSSVAQAAFLLRKSAITTLEDDYNVISKLANLTYPFTHNILVPEVCSVGKWTEKKIGYQGYMKLSYLHPKRFSPDINIKNKYIKEDHYCLLRLAKLTAHHDKGINGLSVELVYELIHLLSDKGITVFLSAEYLPDSRLEKYILKINQNDIHHLLAYSTLLVSDSQSMSVEAAMLGVPSIRYSDFSGKISVLEELEHKYRLTYGIRTDEPGKLIDQVNDILRFNNIKSEFKKRQQKMLNDKIDVAGFCAWFIENYPESAKVMHENPDYQYRFK